MREREKQVRQGRLTRGFACWPPHHHHSTASRPPPPLSTSPPHGPNHATRASTTTSTSSGVHWRTHSQIPPLPSPRRPPHASRECAAARGSRTPTRRSHEPPGSQILYNLARGWPSAGTGPVRTHVMPRILPEPGSQAPHTQCTQAHSAAGVVAEHSGLDSRWCAGCTGGWVPGPTDDHATQPPAIHPARAGREGMTE